MRNKRTKINSLRKRHIRGDTIQIPSITINITMDKEAAGRIKNNPDVVIQKNDSRTLPEIAIELTPPDTLLVIYSAAFYIDKKLITAKYTDLSAENKKKLKFMITQYDKPRRGGRATMKKQKTRRAHPPV